MATNLANEEEGSSRFQNNLNDWKYPKIPVDQVYKKKILRISPSYAIKDYEDTITVNGSDGNVSGSLLSSNFLEGFIREQHRFVHLGLVQIAIKPLMRDGLGAPIVVRVRDARHPDFHNSLLALVNANLSQGPFYFNCFPSFSVSLDDASLFDVLTLDVTTGGIPLALTCRIVCKAMVDLSPKALKQPVFGETAYFQPSTRTSGTTKWDENLVHTLPDDRSPNKGTKIFSNFGKGKMGTAQNRAKQLEDWKYPKIPVNKVYNKFPFLWSKEAYRNFQTVKEYEKTIKLEANNQIDVSLNLLEGLIKKQNNRYLHFGLVQIAIKPLMSDGLGPPIIVCLRDDIYLDFEPSLLELVQADLSQGPFYFNYWPNYSIDSSDIGKRLALNVMSGVPLVLTYRLVVSLNDRCLFNDSTLDPVWGETTYYQPSSKFEKTTKWDEVPVPESWIQRKTSSDA